MLKCNFTDFSEPKWVFSPHFPPSKSLACEFRCLMGGSQAHPVTRNHSVPAAAAAGPDTQQQHRRRKFQKRLPPQQHQHPRPHAYLTVTMGNFLTSPIVEKETKTNARPDNSLAFGLSAMQGWRTSMEDSHIAELKHERLPEGTSLFAVCDGHGGRLAAMIAEQLLIEFIADAFEKYEYFKTKTPTPEEIGVALTEAFMALDLEIKSQPEVSSGSDQSGCTAIAAFLTPTHIIVANSGACVSFCVVCTQA